MRQKKKIEAPVEHKNEFMQDKFLLLHKELHFKEARQLQDTRNITKEIIFVCECMVLTLRHTTVKSGISHAEKGLLTTRNKHVPSYNYRTENGSLLRYGAV
jgi:hypothetical protein